MPLIGRKMAVFLHCRHYGENKNSPVSYTQIALVCSRKVKLVLAVPRVFIVQTSMKTSTAYFLFR